MIGLDKTDVIKMLCEMTESSNNNEGKKILNQHYPFEKIEVVKRTYTKTDMIKVFMKDGFIDRYTGNKLIFPPVLRLLSIIYPNEFPFHSNWKTSECHPAYWDLFPTIDHIRPIARGGRNNSENLVTTSMGKNNAKSNFTLEELGWRLYPPGEIEEWDGQINWFMNFIKRQPEFLKQSYIKSWFDSYSKYIMNDKQTKM
jgi:hypothetical protein